jgi:hypothetical protein
VGNATWEYFPLPQRPSYWIQYTETFGSSIKFINDYWYNISWSKTFNSYYTESDQLIEEAIDVGLGSLVEFLQVQETVKGKKCERQTSLSTQGSSKYPASKRTKEGSSPIPESISDSSSETGQALSRSLELSVGITPTPGEPQFAMSYAATIARTSTQQSHIGAALFSTIGAAGGAPNWPAGSGGHQIVQGGGGG